MFVRFVFEHVFVWLWVLVFGMRLLQCIKLYLMYIECVLCICKYNENVIGRVNSVCGHPRANTIIDVDVMCLFGKILAISNALQ